LPLLPWSPLLPGLLPLLPLLPGLLPLFPGLLPLFPGLLLLTELLALGCADVEVVVVVGGLDGFGGQGPIVS